MLTLDYATRAALFRPDLHQLALLVLTENLRPPNPIAAYLVGRILAIYRVIERNGPNAMDLHLQREAERRALRIQLRAQARRL